MGKRRSWYTITYYYNDVRDWVGNSAYDSKIHVNNIDDRVTDRESAIRYADLIRGKRNLWYSVVKGKH